MRPVLAKGVTDDGTWWVEILAWDGQVIDGEGESLHDALEAAQENRRKYQAELPKWDA